MEGGWDNSTHPSALELAYKKKMRIRPEHHVSAPIYTKWVDSKPRNGPKMWIRFCSSMLKGKTTDEDLGPAVSYSGPWPSPLLSSPIQICLGFPRLVPWETRCNSKHDGKEIRFLLLMAAGFCLQPFIFFLLFQAQGREQTDKHPDSCRVLSNWKSHISGPCPWRRLGHTGAWQTVQRKRICTRASHRHRLIAVAQTRAQLCYLPRSQLSTWPGITTAYSANALSQLLDSMYNSLFFNEISVHEMC